MLGVVTALPWWSVLGVQQKANVEQVRAAYRRLSQKHHPDAGGDPKLRDGKAERAAWDRIAQAHECAKSNGL